MKTLFLVSCSKQKLDKTAPAQELYSSPLFQLARSYVESQLQPGDLWLILSAKYRAVLPTTVIEPYDLSLSKMAAHQRETWGGLIRRCIENSSLREFITIEDPLEGLEIGERLQWLSQRVRKGAL